MLLFLLFEGFVNIWMAYLYQIAEGHVKMQSYLNILLYIYILLSFYACVSTAFLQPPHETLTFILFSVSNLPQSGFLLQTRAHVGPGF